MLLQSVQTILHDSLSHIFEHIIPANPLCKIW